MAKQKSRQSKITEFKTGSLKGSEKKWVGPSRAFRRNAHTLKGDRKGKPWYRRGTTVSKSADPIRIRGYHRKQRTKVHGDKVPPKEGVHKTTREARDEARIVKGKQWTANQVLAEAAHQERQGNIRDAEELRKQATEHTRQSVPASEQGQGHFRSRFRRQG